MWFAGIDWADAHHDVAVVDETGRQQRRAAGGALGRGNGGARHLPAGLLPAAMRAPTPRPILPPDPEQVACIVETTHGLLITALLEAGFPVYPVNPKTLEHWRKPSGAKTDQHRRLSPGAQGPQRSGRAAPPGAR